MNLQLNIKDLSKHLFWDVDKDQMSFDAHKVFVVQRILTYGTLADFKLLRKHLELNEIAEIAKGLRSLDQVTLHFVATITHTPLNEFRCYTSTQSLTNSIDF